MKQKKIDKEFLLTDDSVNVYGFRLLTKGYLMDKYKANPIGYRMHKREDGVVLKWEDFRTDGEKLFAKPVINLSNPLGQQTADEVEGGFLNAASIGGIVVLEFSDAPELMLPGQTGPTITKWYNKETSLVDVPGNPNAVVQLFDANDNEINLVDFIHNTLKKLPIGLLDGINTYSKNSNTNMKKSLIGILAIAGVTNLSDSASDDDVLSQVRALADKANKVSGLEKDLKDAKTAEDKAVKDLADYKAKENAEKNKSIADAGIKSGKLTAETAKDLSDKYKDDPEGFKKLVDGLPAYKPVTDLIDEATAGGELPEKFKGKTIMQLHAEDLLEEFKTKFPNLYDEMKSKK